MCACVCVCPNLRTSTCLWVYGLVERCEICAVLKAAGRDSLQHVQSYDHARVKKKTWAQCWTWFKLILGLLVHSLNHIHLLVNIYIYSMYVFCASTDHVNSCANTKSLSMTSAWFWWQEQAKKSWKSSHKHKRTNYLQKSLAVCSIQLYLFGHLQFWDCDCSTPNWCFKQGQLPIHWLDFCSTIPGSLILNSCFSLGVPKPWRP